MLQLLNRGQECRCSGNRGQECRCSGNRGQECPRSGLDFCRVFRRACDSDSVCGIAGFMSTEMESLVSGAIQILMVAALAGPLSPPGQ